MLLSISPSLQKGADQVRCQPVPHNLGPDAHDLHIVMLHRLVGTVDIVDDGGPNARDLIAGHTGSHAGAAKHNGLFCPTIQHRLAHCPGHIRKIHFFFVIKAAAVQHFVAPLLQNGKHFYFQLESGMVAADRYDHKQSFLSILSLPICQDKPLSPWDPSIDSGRGLQQ